MKKFFLLAAAATMVVAPATASAAQGRNDNRPGIHKVQKTKIVQRANGNRKIVQRVNGNRKVVNIRNNGRQVVRVQPRQIVRVQQTRAHQWSRGQRFDHRYASNYRVVDNYRAYNLQAPPYGYRYVRSNDDIVLVAIASGIIGAVFASIF